MSVLSAIVLGVVQGLTEFLPVSSSGHLVLGQGLLGVKDPGLSFAVWAHLGTTGATIVFLWREIVWLLRGLVSSFSDRIRTEQGAHSPTGPDAEGRSAAVSGGVSPGVSRGDGKAQSDASKDARYARGDAWRVAGLVVLGSVPAALIGLTLENHIERAFSSPILASCGLLFTGSVLFLYGLRERGAVPVRVARANAIETCAAEPFATVNWGRALLTGVAQAVAILPGVSRSGMTIVAGASSGMDREDAARFSFFLALVAVAGGALLDARSALATGVPILADGNLVGATAAFFSGLVALSMVFKTVRKGSFSVFAYYCWAVGLLGLLISVRR